MQRNSSARVRLFAWLVLVSAASLPLSGCRTESAEPAEQPVHATAPPSASRHALVPGSTSAMSRQVETARPLRTTGPSSTPSPGPEDRSPPTAAPGDAPIGYPPPRTAAPPTAGPSPSPFASPPSFPDLAAALPPGGGIVEIENAGASLRWKLAIPAEHGDRQHIFLEQDLTGDGAPEAILFTFEHIDPHAGQEEPETYGLLVYADDGDGQGLLLLDRLDAPQLVDIDGDGAHELLDALPPPQGTPPGLPGGWQVSRWDGVGWRSAETTGAPEPPPLETLDAEALPPSPDHLFWRTRDGIYRWPAEGGPVQELARFDEARSYHSELRDLVQWSVAQQGRMLAWRALSYDEEQDAPGLHLELWRDGERSTLTLPASSLPDGMDIVRDWQLSPDGHRLAVSDEYFAQTSMGTTTIAFVDVGTGEILGEASCHPDPDRPDASGACIVGALDPEGSRFYMIDPGGLHVMGVDGGAPRLLQAHKPYEPWDSAHWLWGGRTLLARWYWEYGEANALIAADSGVVEHTVGSLDLQRANDATRLAFVRRDTSWHQVEPQRLEELLLQEDEAPVFRTLLPRPEFPQRRVEIDGLSYAGDTLRALLWTGLGDYASHALVSIEPDGRLSHLTRIPSIGDAEQAPSRDGFRSRFSRTGHVLLLSRQGRVDPDGRDVGATRWVMLGDGSRRWDASALLAGAEEIEWGSSWRSHEP